MAIMNEPTISRLDFGNAEVVRIGPERVALLATGAETGGSQLVIEVTTPPGGGPPLHTHPAQEVFVVVEVSSPSQRSRPGRCEASAPRLARPSSF